MILKMKSRSDMRIIIDTREQEEYSFSCSSIKKKLAAGDYSIEGFENRVAVERKSLDDFVNTVIRGRKRFYKELCILKDYDHACVVVEGNIRDLLTGNYHSGAHPNSLMGSAVAITVNLNIPVFFCGDRQAACRFTEEYLKHVYRKCAIEK
jgi:ERCC4-type nuclease